MRALTLGLLATLLCGAPAAAEAVKMARTGACYAADDPYHEGIVPQRTFATMVDCVGSGGWDRRGGTPERAPMGFAAHGWVPVEPGPAFEANRGAQANEATAWFQPTGGCREARDDLLARAARAPVAWSADGCRVARGVWTDAFTGAVLTDPERVEIAHVVPPTWAEARGATAWASERRAAFYTDPTNLLAVSAESRAAWAGRAPMEWRPYDQALACAHANAFAAVAVRHGVAYTESDAYSMQAAIDAACTAPTREDLDAARADRERLALAQRAAIDEARLGAPARDALRSTNPPAPATNVGGTPATLPTSATELPMEGDPAFDQRDVGVATPSERPPIALPGIYTAPRATAGPAPSGTDGQPNGLSANTTGNGQERITLEQLRTLPPAILAELIDEEDIIIEGVNDDGGPVDMARLAEVLATLQSTTPPATPNAAPQDQMAVPVPGTGTPGADESGASGAPMLNGDPAMMGITGPGANVTFGTFGD